MKTWHNKGSKATKQGFGEALAEAATHHPNIIGLGSDITASVGMNLFAEKFPERFYSLGIAEQNAVGISAGLALSKLLPVFSTYGVFASMRTLDQIRISLCYNNLHVIIGGAHAGISVGPDGATHQALEDIAALSALPNITILSPADATQAYLATMAAIEKATGPVYIRFGREPMADFTDMAQEFTIGKAQTLRQGNDIALIATGHLLWFCLEAANELAKLGIEAEVINMHTIKPLDEVAIQQSAAKCGCILSAEEHQITGGLSALVSQVVVRKHPVPMDFVGMPNCFGESGKAEELMLKYGMSTEAIIQKSLQLIERKNHEK
jgi:transketolase